VTSIRSSFPKAPAPALPIDELERLAKQAWRQRGVLILWVDQVTDGWERQFLENLGRRAYGKRNAGD
jgi:hypothetical protein